MKVLVLDNYDSFTYNIVHQLRELGVDHEVHRNDRIEVSEANNYDKLILSPGPGIPDEAGLLKKIIKAYLGRKPMLGVCLGHQAIAEICGGTLKLLAEVHHGVETTIQLNTSNSLFTGLPSEISVGRYHSWVVDPDTFPKQLEITATDHHGEIMAFSHVNHDVHGLQFHPESIMTDYGMEIVKRFVYPTGGDTLQT